MREFNREAKLLSLATEAVLSCWLLRAVITFASRAFEVSPCCDSGARCGRESYRRLLPIGWLGNRLSHLALRVIAR